MIKRKPRVKNFTVISNEICKPQNLSFQAMGLLTYLLSKPDNWKVLPSALIKVTVGTMKHTGKSGIYSILKELKEKKYIEMIKNSDGTVDYFVGDEPYKKPDMHNEDQDKKPDLDKPDLHKPDLHNPHTYKELTATKNLLSLKTIVEDEFEKLWDCQPWGKISKAPAFKEFNKLTNKMKTEEQIKDFSLMLNIDWDKRHSYVAGRQGTWKKKMVTYLKEEVWLDESMPVVFGQPVESMIVEPIQAQVLTGEESNSNTKGIDNNPLECEFKEIEI